MLSKDPKSRSVVQLEPLEVRSLLSDAVAPTATLSAPQLTLWDSNYNFRVVYRDNVAINKSTFDNYDLNITGPNGFSRKARFVNFKSDSAGLVNARYKLSAPNGFWDAADNGVYTVTMRSRQVADSSGNVVRSGAKGTFKVAVPAYPTTSTGPGAGGNGFIDITQFGAVADDAVDDSAAIQAAINSMPKDGDGVPDAGTAFGGIVNFPKGRFIVAKQLELPPGVRLRGQGSTTILQGTSTDSTAGVIRLVTSYSHGFVIRAGIQDMTINSNAGKGIHINASPRGDMIGLRISGVEFSTAGTSIDLSTIDVYEAEIQDVIVRNPGGGALILGRGTGSNAVNNVSNFSVVGTARSGFNLSGAMVVLHGDVTVDHLSVSDIGVPTLPLSVHGSATLNAITLPSTNLRDNFAAKFENAGRVMLDSFNGLSATRKIDLLACKDIRIGVLGLAGNATLASSLRIDAASHLTLDRLVGANPGDVSARQFSVRSASQSFAFPALSAIQNNPRNINPVSSQLAYASAFGAVGNDGIDDAAAIQRAIDSLSTGAGAPNAGNAFGGTVMLPRGRLNLGASLRLPSGIWLRGQGSATILHFAGGDARSVAVQLVSAPVNGGFNVGAGVVDLSIYTVAAAAIRPDTGSITQSLVDLHLSGLQISAGGPAIDLSAVKTYHASINDIGVDNPGSTALWVGDLAQYSADNYIGNLNLSGTARPGFNVNRAIVVIQGQNFTFENSWIEQPAKGVALPLSISGSGSIRGLWLEYPPENLPDGIAARLEQANVTFDRLGAIDDRRRLSLQSSNVTIGSFSVAGRDIRLADAFVLDNASRISIGTVTAIRDAGSLDDPRFSIGGVYNQMSATFIDTAKALSSQNFLADPTFSSIGRDANSWAIQWGDALGAVTGTATVENTSSGPRLKIQILSNPNKRTVTVRGALGIPANLIGGSGLARWRIDGPEQALVWTRNFKGQYASRAMNSLTASVVPGVLGAGDQILFQLSGTGTYYISNVGVTAA